MRIHIFSYVFWPESFLVNELAEEFVKRGHQITAVTGLPNYPEGEFFPGYSRAQGPFREEWKGVTIQRYAILPRKKGFIRLAVNYLSHLFGGIGAAFRLPDADWAFVFATSPITTALPAIVWAKWRRRRVCIWLQDLWPDSVAAVGATKRHSLVEKSIGLVVRFIYRFTDLMLIQSPAFTENLKTYGFRGPSYFVPNWAPSLDPGNESRPGWFDADTDPFTVTFAGNIGKAQALDVVLEAARLLQDEQRAAPSSRTVQFAIVGDGSELAKLRHEVERLKLGNVKFFGRRPLADMPGLFKASDALLVTLKKEPIFAQTIPSKVQAYMAAGRPLVAGLDGVGRELIETVGCGVTAPAEDSTNLAKAVRRLASMTDAERAVLGAKASRHFDENFRCDRVLSQIERALSESGGKHSSVTRFGESRA